ncbi:MAG: cytochrome c5 family protein [Pseudomonadales bacterium]|nr:cytochrome c5 family protein [Pseudomonadales bacterium]
MKKLLWTVAALVMTTAMFQLAGASQVEDEIAARITKVGDVCVEGQDCAQGTASATTVASNGGGNGAKATFEKTCSTCHATGVAGAPKFGDHDAWAPRIDQGMDALYHSAIAGKPPGMPAKGMCFTCSDDDLKAVVDYMVNAAK